MAYMMKTLDARGAHGFNARRPLTLHGIARGWLPLMAIVAAIPAAHAEHVRTAAAPDIRIIDFASRAPRAATKLKVNPGEVYYMLAVAEEHQAVLARFEAAQLLPMADAPDGGGICE